MAKRYEDKNGVNRPGALAVSGVALKFQQKNRGEQPDWGRIDPELLWKLIQRMTVDDGAVMFGYSRDGGAYSLKVYSGGEAEKAYFHTDAEILSFIGYLLED